MKKDAIQKTIARSRHHAQELLPFVKVMGDMLKPLPRMKLEVNRMIAVNPNGTFVVRAYTKGGKYTGIKILQDGKVKVKLVPVA